MFDKNGLVPVKVSYYKKSKSDLALVSCFLSCHDTSLSCVHTSDSIIMPSVVM
jgi:hypothetical protein